MKMKNISKLVGWFTLASLESIKRNLDNPDCLTFIWRESDQEFKLIMQNANECVNLIVKRLKAKGMGVHKNYEKVKK